MNQPDFSQAASLAKRIGCVDLLAIGASAGGVSALEDFFGALETDLGMAFLVVQHLAPNRESHMDQLLARKSKLPIHTLNDGDELLAGHVYLLPSRKELRLEGMRAELIEPTEPRQNRIDELLTQLAHSNGQSVAAMILSGSGSDGSRGAQQVLESGGVLLIQDPKSAEFESMPVATQAICIPDLRLSPEGLAYALDMLRGASDEAARVQLAALWQNLPSLLDVLQDAHGLDFSLYKQSLIARRVERRISIHAASRGKREVSLEDVFEYFSSLRLEEVEQERLCRDFLIGATQFFRDPLAFVGLSKMALPGILDSCAERGELRVWVAGCASGEEAYSLAMILLEELDQRGLDIILRVFATDVHDESIEYAEKGEYPAEALMSVSPERRERFFTSCEGGFRVMPKVREKIIFRRHDLLQDTPFVGMDLVCCRNMMIYLADKARADALERLHFALRGNGILFLGTSETPERRPGLYRRLAQDIPLWTKAPDAPDLTQLSRFADSARLFDQRNHRAPRPARMPDRSPGEAYARFLETMVDCGAAIAQSGEILHTFGDLGQILPLRGQTPFRLPELVAEDAKALIVTCMMRAEASSDPVRSGFAVRLVDSDEAPTFFVEVQAAPRGEDEAESVFLVRFLPDEEQAQLVQAIEGHSDPAPASSEEERLRTLLRTAHKDLQVLMQELGTRNEQLQAANEELVSSNEELQSLNEEMQSVNEELHTVNTEYQRKIDELQLMTTDIEGFLEHSETALVIFGADLAVRQFTREGARYFNLRQGDIGRSLMHVKASFDDDELHGALVAAREQLASTELRVTTVGSTESPPRHLLVKVRPILNSSGRLSGVVLALVDVTELTEALQRLAVSEAQLDLLFRHSPVMLAHYEHDFRMRRTNDRVQELLGQDAEALEGRSFLELLPDDEAPGVGARVRGLRPGDESASDHSVTLPSGEHRTLRWIHRSVPEVEGEQATYIAVGLDVTHEQALASQVQRAEVLLEQTPVSIFGFDLSGRVLFVSDAWLRALGYQRDRVVGALLEDFLTPKSRERLGEILGHLREQGVCCGVPLEFQRAGGESIGLELTANRVRDELLSEEHVLGVVLPHREALERTR